MSRRHLRGLHGKKEKKFKRHSKWEEEEEKTIARGMKESEKTKQGRTYGRKDDPQKNIVAVTNAER